MTNTKQSIFGDYVSLQYEYGTIVICLAVIIFPRRDAVDLRRIRRYASNISLADSARCRAIIRSASRVRSVPPVLVG